MQISLWCNHLVCDAYKRVTSTERERWKATEISHWSSITASWFSSYLHYTYCMFQAFTGCMHFFFFFCIYTEGLCATSPLVLLLSKPTFPFMWGLAPHGWPQTSLQEISKINICAFFEHVSVSICGALARVLPKRPGPLMTLTSCV